MKDTRTKKEILAEIKKLEKEQEQIYRKMQSDALKLYECKKLQKAQGELASRWNDLRQQIDARREIASGFDEQLRRELKHG